MNKKMNQKINNTTIIGDVTCGDKVTNVNVYYNDYLESDLSLSEIVESSIVKSSHSVSKAIKRFKELNPNLDLKISNTEKTTNYLIQNIGPSEVNIGNIIFKNRGVSKLNKCLEEGYSIELEEDEFDFLPDIKGLPSSSEDLKKKLQIQNHFKPSIAPIKIIVLDSEGRICNEIYSNLHLIRYGSKVMTMKISGLNLLGDLSFTFNHIEQSFGNLNFDFDYQTTEIEKLLNTLIFIHQLKSQFSIEIILIENNTPIFGFNVSDLEIEIQLLDEQINFYKKYNDVIKTYALKPIPASQLSEDECAVINIIHAYINHYSLALNNYPIVITAENPSNEFRSTIDDPSLFEKLVLTAECDREFEILNKKIIIKNLKIFFVKPYVYKIEDAKYFIKSDHIIFNFLNEV